MTLAHEVIWFISIDKIKLVLAHLGLDYPETFSLVNLSLLFFASGILSRFNMLYGKFDLLLSDT